MIETLKRHWLLLAGVVVAVVLLATWRAARPGSVAVPVSEPHHWWKGDLRV